MTDPNSPAGSRDNLFSMDLFPGPQPAAQQAGPTAFQNGYVNYSSSSQFDPNVPAFIRSRDLMTLDPDVDGSRTEAWARGMGASLGRDYVAGLTVFGRPMSRETLMQSEAGMQLLDIAAKDRAGVQRGFMEAVTDWSVSDAPFVGMVASVGGSIADAVTVSDTMKKLQNGEEVTDDDLVKTRLYMARQERESKGSWGATVGGIVRAAPGFMVEMLASGGLAAAARGGAVKAGVGGTHLAMTQATKTLARESVEDLAEKAVAKAAGKTTAKGLTKEFAELAGTDAEKEIVASVARQLFGFMKSDAAGAMYKGFSDDALIAMAESRARLEFGRMVARRGGSAVSNGFNTFTQWLGRNVSRGLLDYGSYGTEEATVLFTRQSSAGRALADAIGVFAVEAPIKGTVLMLPKKAVERGVVAPLFGQDGRVVGQNELSLQTSALMTGNRNLMDSAESIALGMDLLEYVSENTGRGLKSVLAAGGMGLERLGVKGLVRPVATAVSSAGHMLPEVGNEAITVGGKMRQFIHKVFGSRSEYAARVAGQEADLVAKRLGVTSAAERAALRSALLTGNLQGLRAEIRDAIGDNVEKFVADTVSQAYESGVRDLQYKTYAKYAAAKWMQKHGVGPETVMNLWNQMGQDGVLGEMFEERYSDVVKGLLGLDDRSDTAKLAPGVETPETASFLNNVKEAVKGLYPGWEQLTAEAVGFMFPMVTRGLTMRAMSAIGGGGQYAELRSKLGVIEDAMRHNTVGEMTFSEAEAAFAHVNRQEAAEIAKLDERLKAARAAGDAAGVESLEKEIATRAEVAEERRRRQEAYFATVDEAAKQTADALIAVPVDTYGTLSSDAAGRAPVLSESEAREVLAAQRALGDFGSQLARQLVEGQLPLEGESEGMFRKLARRLVGVAGFLVTGDFSLAAVNPVQWTARDMGLSKNVVDALREGFRTQLALVRKELPDGTPAKDVLDETQRRFDFRARQIMTANLAVHQLRSFSDGRLRETAAAQWAATHPDTDGRAWHYTVDSEGRAAFYKLAEDGQSVDETSVKSLADMYRDHGDEISELKSQILKATVDIMSRRLTGADAGRNAAMAAMTISPDSDLLDVAIYDAAMHMIGAQDLLYRVSLDGQTPLRAVMGARSVARVSDDVVDYIASKDRLEDVNGLAVESVAQALHLGFDGTEEGLARRNEKIFRMAKLMRMNRREGWLYFSKEILEDNSDELRMSANGTSTLVAKRQEDGSYAVDFGVKKDNPKERDVRIYKSEASLFGAMLRRGYVRDAAHTVLTQAKIIESSDLFWMIRELGLAREYFDLLGSRAPAWTHPMLRRGEDGKFLPQAEAERTLARELAAAERGRHAEEGTSERAAFERVLGENGYITVGEGLLRSHGGFKGSISPYVGEFHEYAPVRYTFLMSTGKISPKSADTYVVIDPHDGADVTSGLVNAVLLNAYMRNGGLLRDALGNVVSDFVKDVRRIAKEALAEAEKAKDGELAAQLRDFLRICCDDVDREVVKADGHREIKRGIGLSSKGFVTLANAFGLFRASADSTNPMLRAVATIAPRVWGTLSFVQFEGLLNVTLGGNYLDHAIWSAKPGEKSYADPALAGVPRLMALASGDPDALRRAVQASLPASMGYEQFLDAVIAQLAAQSKTGEPAITDEEKAELRAKARAAAAPNADPAAHFTFLGGLVSTLKTAIDRKVTVSKGVTDFLAEVLAAVRNDPKTTDAQRNAAERQLEYLRKRSSDTEDERAYVLQSEELDRTRERLAEAQEELAAARQKIVDLEQRGLAAQIAVETGEGSAVPPPTEAERSAAQTAVAQALAKSDDAKAAVAKQEEAVKKLVPEGVKVQADLKGGDTLGDSLADAVLEGTPEDSYDDMTVYNDPAGVDVPEVFAREAALRQDGFTMEWGRPADYVNKRLNRRQARLAASVVVRSLADVDEDSVAHRVREMFPHMDDAERDDIVAAFRDLDAIRVSGDRTWAQMVEAGRHIGVQEDDDSDEHRSSENFNERALAEYNDESLKDFAALAQRAASESMGSIMGFIGELRSRVRTLDTGVSQNDLLRGLLCPQLRPGLKSLAQADAYHKQTLDRFADRGVQADIEKLVETDPPAAFLVSYLSSLPINARTRFAGLCAGAVAAAPLQVQNGVMTPKSSEPDGKIPDSLVADSVDALVGMSARRIGKAADRLLEGAKKLDFLAEGSNYEKLCHNARQVADLLATVFGRNNPLYVALTSDIARRTWAAKPSVEGELLKAVSYDEKFGVGVVSTIASAMKVLAARGHEPSRLEVESLFIAAFTMGGFGGNVGMTRAPAQMDTTDPLLTFLNMYQAGLPRTMMRSRIDQRRDRTASSVVVAPRGMVPLLSRWLYQEGEGSFMDICRKVWNASDELIAECRQDGTWPNDARTPICAKCISTSLTPREVYAACRKASESGGISWVPLYSGDHSTSTILQVPQKAREFGFTVPAEAFEVGETSEIDGVGIVWEKADRKGGSSAWFDRKDGKIHVNAEGVRQKFRDGAHLGPLRSGPIRGVENIKTEDDLVRWVVYHELAHKSLSPTKDKDGNRVANALEIEDKANEMASIRAGIYKPTSHEAKKSPEAPVSALTAQAEAAPEVRAAPKDYKALGKAVYRAIGMHLMFTDTKRSAVSSLEAQGTGLVGESNGTYGEHRVHILHNYAKGASNEAFLGSTFMTGYGVRQIGNMSADSESGTKKVHIVGGAGRDLFFIKSLTISQSEERGKFRKGTAPYAVFDYAEKFRGDDPLSTDTFTDDDSYKIGPGNSKGLRAANGGGDSTIMGFVFDRIVRHLVETGALREGYGQEELAKALGSYDKMTGDELDEAVGAILVRDNARGETREMKLSEVLPGAVVNVFEGWSGPAVDLSYKEDSAMAYTVANVSHRSDVPADPGRSPRNYEVDALAMARTLAAGGWLKVPGLDSALHRLVSDWGVLASSVYMHPQFRQALIRTNEAIAELARNGEFVTERGTFSGQFAVEELTRQMMAKMRQAANLPLQGIDAPLVAAGASIGPDGELEYHGSGEMEKAMLKGSELFSDEERGFYGADRRLALCNVNVSNNGFRYGWFLDEDAVAAERARPDSLVAAAYRAAEADPRAAGHPGRVHALAIGWLARAVRERTRAIPSAEDGEKARKDALEARTAFAGMFADHHGVSIAKYGDQYLRSFGVEDLFVPTEGSSAEFDLSAVQCEGQDLVPNDATGKRHVFLGGTSFGFPRTPSYNGAPWLQVVRAGLPVTETEVPGAAQGERNWLPGGDAMVQPDPYTNKILGSDHDGDKAKLYMFSVNGIGDVQDATLPEIPEGVSFTGEDGPARRSEYLVACARQGFLERVRLDESGNETVLDADDATPDSYFRISTLARKKVSNSFVRTLFALSRQLPVDAVVERGSSVGLAPRTAPGAESGRPRAKFLGGIASPSTEAFPGGKAAKDSVLDQGLPPLVLPDGSIGTLGDPDKAADIEDSALDAGDARGVMVSLARTLHMAWALGAYSGDYKNSSDYASLLGNMTGTEWLNFMHLVDGISNATFDDIKEQLCGRLGWTKGMMDSVVTELLMWPKSLPTTKREFLKILASYVGNIKSRGSRYWMLRNSKVDDAEAHEAIIGSVVGETRFWVGRARFLERLGLAEVSGDTGTSIVHDEGAPSTVAGAIGAALVELSQVKGILGSAAYGQGMNATMAQLYHAAVRGLHNAGLDKYLTVGRDSSGAPIYTFSGGQPLTGEEFDAVVDAIGDSFGKMHIDQWAKRHSLLLGARSVAQSVLYLTADPGNPSADSTRKRLQDTFDGFVENGGLASDAPGAIPPECVHRMHEATMMLYDAGEDLYTCVSRAVSSLGRRNDHIVALAGTANGKAAAGRLLAKDTVSAYDLMALQSNQQQVPLLAEFFAGSIDDVLEPTGLDGRGTWEMLRRFAVNVAQANALGSGSMAGAREGVQAVQEAMAAAPNADVVERVGGIMDQLRSGFTPFPLAARAAVESMMSICYQLMVTSTEFQADDANRAVQFLRISPDGAYVKRRGGKLVARDSGSYGVVSADIRKITPAFRANSQARLEKIRDMFDRVIGGLAFVGARRLPESVPGKDFTKAKSFALSRRTLVDYVVELIHAKAAPKTLEDIEKLGLPADKMRDVRYAWLALGDDKTEVTPAMLFGALLPAYTLMTARMAGVPSAESRSVLACLPERYYSALSSAEAARRRSGDHIVPLMVGCNWATETFQTGLDSVVTAADDYDLDVTDDLEETRAALRGGHGRKEFRRNPNNSNTVDVFDPAFEEALAVLHEGTGALTALPKATCAERISEGAYDPDTAKLAMAMGALLGSWATVEYNGGKVFTIRGGLRGDAGAGKAVSIVVDTSDGGLLDSEEDVERLASSSAYAASLTAAVDLGMSAEEFLLLPKETRKALVRKFGVGGAASSKVSWTMSAKGVATLVGRISVSSSGGTKVYHEYFHSMMRMFESFGFFGEKDYEQLRATFGADPSGRHQFNEEKAAEAFRKWVEGNTDRSAQEVRGVFRRILDFLKGLLEALKLGFSFEDREGAETLFRMMVHGIAQPSTARLGEVQLEQAAAASAIRDKFRMKRDKPKPRTKTTRKTLEAAARAETPVAPSSMFLELEDDPDYDTVLKTTSLADQSEALESGVNKAIADGVLDIGSLALRLQGLVKVRRQIADITRAGIDVPGGFPAYDAAGTADFTVDDPVADELKKVTSPLVDNSLFYRASNSIRESLEHGLRETGAWTDDLEYVVRRYSAADAQSAQDEALRKRSIVHGLRRAMERVNPEAAKTVANEEIEGSLAFRAALVMHQHLEADFLAKRSAGSNPMAQAARHASQYQVSAWVLSTDPAAPTEMVQDARARVAELYDESKSAHSRAELRMILAQLDRLDDVVGDQTKLSQFRRDHGTKVLNEVIMSLRAGTKTDGIDENGVVRAIRPIDVKDPDGDLSDPENVGTANPKAARHLRSLLHSYEDPRVQEALKLALSTAYQVAAMAKFYEELDVHPAPRGDIAEAKRLARLNGIPGHMSSLEFLGEHLVGDSSMVDNPAYVDYACQSHFIAQNVDAWLRSMVRTQFGAHEGLGQMMSDEHFEYAGLVNAVTLKENWIAHMLGVSLEPGGRLLEVIRQKGEYKFEDGEIVREVNGEFVKFDNYGRKQSSVTLTEEDLRRIDFWYKMCTAHAAGQKYVVTGVDGLSFYRQMSRNAEDYSIEKVKERRERNENLNPMEWAVWRMTRQAPPDLLPAVHAKFVGAVISAMAEADRMQAEGVHVNGPYGTEAEPAVNDASTYSSFVIGRLVRAGVVVGFNPGGARHARGGLTRYDNASLVISCDFIDEQFKKSDTYAEKLVRQGGRDPKWIDRDFIAKELMSVWDDTVRFVKRHPWLTHGDGQYFHAFGTALPFWRGSGVFMYNAVRTDRQNRLTPSDKMSAAEAMVQRVMSSGAADSRLAAMDDPNTVDDADFVARFIGAKTRGALFLQDVVAGKYAAGEDLAEETGISIPADATYADLAKAVYDKARQLVWASRTGYAGEGHRDLEGVIERYEDSRLERGEIFGGSMGFNDLDMYRMHGTLPANYQLGHKVHKCIDGLTNAMMSRATLANLLLTPEGSTGAPVYYADPNALAAEASGLPDAFWGNLAEWWQRHNDEDERAVKIGQVYDPAKSGVQNAKAVYEALRQAHQVEGKSAKKTAIGALGYTELPGDDSQLVSVDRWMVLDGNGDDFMNATCGGEAMGYLRHFLEAGKTLGFGGAKARAAIQRALSYSKSLSVSFSFFFPLATRWESPIGAVGALSTIGSNWKAVGDWMKEHPDAANRIRGMFGGSAWITHDFIGMKDIVRMMDSNDPFLAELYSWAAALGVTVSTSVTNPMEPDKTVLLKDIRRMKEAIRSSMGAKAAGKFARMMDAILVRQGDKAFNYVLNATKLAVVAQMCMKLRHQAKAQGRAFDPVRDLRKYSRYINAEIGGIDPMQFAWAHPKARGLMNAVLFSWQWTVGAWQAGGGSVVTDLLTGGHTMTRRERAYLAGRWMRMFLGVMIGVPALFQAFTMIAARLLGGGDGDDDHWGTWENEDKARWTAFDLTPLLKAVAAADETKLGGLLRRFKENGAPATSAMGALAGAVAGAMGGNWLTGAIGAALGAGAGATAPRLVPLYTGGDAANRMTHQRRYYMHFGKQGWEFFRWFDDAKAQFFSKMSMPVQRMAEGVMGRSLGFLERSLPWEEMGQFERWLSPTTDSALFNLAEAFLPFSVGGMNRNGDAGVLPIFGPVQMGASQTATQKKLVAALEKWAANDRSGYAYSTARKGRNAGKPRDVVAEILRDAEVNGLDGIDQLNKACGQVTRNYYGKLFDLLPEKADGEFDVQEASRIFRALNRLGSRKANAMAALKARYKTAGREWKSLTPEMRRMVASAVAEGFRNPYGY